MKSSTDDAKQTPAKTAATPATAKTAEVSRAEAIARKIAQLKEMERQTNARQTFQDTLEGIEQSLTEINRSEVGSWDKEPDYRVTFQKYERQVLFAFSQKNLLIEFLLFTQKKIQDSIFEIDTTLLGHEL